MKRFTSIYARRRKQIQEEISRIYDGKC